MTRLLYEAAARNNGTAGLLLDLDSLIDNLNFFRSHSRGKKIRVATKSIRSLDVLRLIRKNLHDSFAGLMAYDLREAIWLVENGFDDVLIGYPQFDETSLRILNESSKLRECITLMIDSSEHVKMLNGLNPLRLCVDIDMSLRLPGLNFGVFRSGISHVKQLRELKEAVSSSAHKIIGLMGYEAQIAGLPDSNGFLTIIIKLLKKLSKNKIIKFREDAKSVFHELDFFNGGGTGSIHFSVLDESVSEITIGSGFYCPTLFDNYDHLQLKPSFYFMLPVVRKPKQDVVTCLGGGYIGSGSIGGDKVPLPIFPKGLKLISAEMTGEVQTPLTGRGAKQLNVGDSVFFRPSKAGEICERFEFISSVNSKGDRNVFKTYRGEGKCFY
jgi:D-serine deaminase-like pyridoxal phosphate-dependent protein